MNKINPGFFFLLNFIPIVKFFEQFQAAWYWNRKSVSEEWLWYHQLSLLKYEDGILQSFMLQGSSAN